jgi:DNA-directed RNA polymerase
MELNKALELEDPTTYVCSLPVHQDGTCNGLQHYAALGGDTKGAQQVNLLASDRPSDVYTHISVSVEKEMQLEAEAGNELAKLLLGKVTRKVVKQTVRSFFYFRWDVVADFGAQVMTTVYGVTFVGAREQIERQLKDRGDIPSELAWNASSYLAKKVLFYFPTTHHFLAY